MREDEQTDAESIEAKLRSRELLPGREAKYTKDGREILLFRCSDCGFTLEDTTIESDFRCPLCDAENYFFLEVDFKLFPNIYINQAYIEDEIRGVS